MKKVMVAMSGGVDSSATAAVLRDAGYDIVGGTLRLYEKNGPSPEVASAKEVCQKLGAEHFVFDKRELFGQKVIEAFKNEYDAGRTPNPCIECNKYIKFGALLSEALALGCDYIATGHYSKIKDVNGRRLICRAADTKKDQTYVLWRLSPEQLSHILMPLGDLSKDDARAIAEKYGFSCKAAKESQDICFVPDGDYAKFLQELSGSPFEKGEYVDIDGNFLGGNMGHQCYTVGQRKGLGIALGRPQFVLSKDPACNRVVLGDEEHLFKKRIYINNVNLQAFDFKNDFICTAKLRYSAKDSACKVFKTGESEAVIEFSEPQRAPSPGQSAVFYDGEYLLGGGYILKGE